MASPVGHSLVGLAVGAGPGAARAVPVAPILFALFAANAADLDYVAGLLAGDLGRFHRGASHSLFAAVVFAVVAGLAIRRWRGGSFPRAAAWAGLLYLSHIVLDLLGSDRGGPSGTPLLWPLHGGAIQWPWPVLPGLTSITDGTQVGTFLRSLASAANARAVLVEILVFGPLALLAWRGRVRQVRSRCPGASA